MRLLGAVICVVLAACTGREAARRLPPATGTYRHVDNTIVFTLPDTGGYLANGAPIDTARLLRILSEVFAPRPASLRAVFVWHNDRRPWGDEELIARMAAAAGGRAFDAALSGWPREEPPPASVH